MIPSSRNEEATFALWDDLNYIKDKLCAGNCIDRQDALHRLDELRDRARDGTLIVIEKPTENQR